MSIFSDRLSALFESHKVKRKSLAEHLGVTYRTINNYENGTREPNIEQLNNIADFFGVSVDYLMGRSDNPYASEGPTDNAVPPEDADFYAWVEKHVTGQQFYDFQKAMKDQEWLKSLRVVYEREKDRRPGQKQGE